MSLEGGPKRLGDHSNDFNIPQLSPTTVGKKHGKNFGDLGDGSMALIFTHIN